MTGIQNDLARLLEACSQKQTLALEFLDLTRYHAKSLNRFNQGDEEKNLEELLAARQSVIDKINNLDKEIRTLKAILSNSQDGGNDIKNAIVDTEKKIYTIFQEAQEIDRQNTQMIQKIMGDLSRRIKSLQAGKVSFSTYKKKPRQVQGFFIDKKK